MSDNIRELARSGDINAIATIIEQEIGLTVGPKLQHGLLLVLKVKSTDLRISQKIIRLVEEIQPGIRSINVSGINWSLYFTLKDGKYVENTNTIAGIMLAIILLIGSCITLANIFYKPPVPVISATPPSDGAYIGMSSTGHALYFNGMCVTVKGVTTAEIQALNTNIDGFKKLIKQETGRRCVLLG